MAHPRPKKLLRSLLFAATLFSAASAQWHIRPYARLGACPTLGCVFPPDQADFLAGQLFDIRLEAHAPTSGWEATDGVPDENFTFCIQKAGRPCVDAAEFFKQPEAPLEKWTFTYLEDLFAADANETIAVNVASKAYRAVALREPGRYRAVLTYNGGAQTVANWVVREPRRRVAKNVILFIGDGMTQAMITAARLIGHKSINGKYQTLMQMDQMQAFGMQMTHSIDTFITDSANSASAMYTGKKSSVDSLNVYTDSSESVFDDPKFETIGELFKRRTGGPLGIVSTASVADATPAAVCAHSRTRFEPQAIVTEFLYNTSHISPDLHWPTSCGGPDVLFGGGAELFIPGTGSPNGTDFYEAFRGKGYQVVHDNTALKALDAKKKTLGIFSVSHMAKWIDRQVLPENLKNKRNHPTGDGSDAVDQPGLKDMTLKAIDILQARSKRNQGWFMMSEAANIDKMMHELDYERALGELLELDDTVRATIAHLKKIGELENTLIVVTADHGHGFDVFGGADTKYLKQAPDARKKRAAVGAYSLSGMSEYQVAPGEKWDNQTILFGAQGPHFPVQWTPRYTMAAGAGGVPDHRAAYGLSMNGPRRPTAQIPGGGYGPNPQDAVDGFVIGGALPLEHPQGVHSLQDVPVFAQGPGADAFRGVYNSIEIFFKIADALGLAEN